nr:hypothetical protein [Propionibacteriales bacterium]
LLYTPGDNDWTDCDGRAGGSYNPLERLDKLRKVFFGRPGVTLGQRPMRVGSQAGAGFPENVTWKMANVTFSMVHIVGGNNGLIPWAGHTTATPQQTAEVMARVAADVQQIHDAFRSARRSGSRAVVLMTQADMFGSPPSSARFATRYGFQAIVQAFSREARRYRKPVYLFSGDSHTYRRGNPLAPGSPWLRLYHVAPVPKLTRYVVEGSTHDDEWLKVAVHANGPRVITTRRVAFDG